MTNPGAAREEILGKVRAALGRKAGSPVPPLPSTARVAPRGAGEEDAEIDQLLAEAAKLSASTRRLGGPEEIGLAVAELVAAEQVKKATLWGTAELAELGLADALLAQGVEIVPSQADRRQLAGCDLGITGVDAALSETSSLLLRSSPEKPRLVSLLPRVHLAILRPAALRPNLQQALAEAKGEGYAVLVTGPSRTSDIEMTLTIGVHGPRALHVWVVAT